MKPWARYTLVGVLWEFWHFTNRHYGKSIEESIETIIIWYPLVIGFSFLAGILTEKTKSMLVAVAVHLSINMFGESEAVLAAILTLCLWSLIIWKWPETGNSGEVVSPK